jgi:hypothetical protein
LTASGRLQQRIRRPNVELELQTKALETAMMQLTRWYGLGHSREGNKAVERLANTSSMNRMKKNPKKMNIIECKMKATSRSI